MFTVLVVTADHQKRHRICDAVRVDYYNPIAVQAACSTQECLLRLEKSRIDMIVLDVEMTGVNMNAIVHWMKQNNAKCFMMVLKDFDRFDLKEFADVFPGADHFRRPYTELEHLLTLREAVQICDTKAVTPGETVKNDKETLRMQLVRERVERFVQEHYSEPLSTQDVAQAMNYSDAHFCRLFKECFHTSFIGYLNDYRVQRAKHMLVTSNESVKEIGMQCGYRNPCYFIRVFKQATGMTPAEYRVNPEER